MFSTAAERGVPWYDGELEAPGPWAVPELHGRTGGLVFVRYCGWTVGSSNEAEFYYAWAFAAQSRRAGKAHLFYLLCAKPGFQAAL
jgi:hypothetical protein